jgi:hypothetical protein
MNTLEEIRSYIKKIVVILLFSSYYCKLSTKKLVLRKGKAVKRKTFHSAQH